MSSVNAKVVKPQTASRAVAETLRQEIVDGHLEPGARLRQGEIAARLGVSTTPVREALLALQSEGLVKIDPHRGAFVFRRSAEEIREFFLIRGALETLAVELALPNVGDSDVVSLAGLLDEMAAASDLVEWLAMNDRFHGEMYELSGRPRLCGLIVDMHEGSGHARKLYAQKHLRRGVAEAEHARILQALEARDLDGTKAAVLTHLSSTLDDVLSFVDDASEHDLLG